LEDFALHLFLFLTGLPDWLTYPFSFDEENGGCLFVLWNEWLFSIFSRRGTRSMKAQVFGRGDAHVAQLAEHVLGKDEVTGSIPVMGSSALGE
jgi:hypothetical protein